MPSERSDLLILVFAISSAFRLPIMNLLIVQSQPMMIEHLTSRQRLNTKNTTNMSSLSEISCLNSFLSKCWPAIRPTRFTVVELQAENLWKLLNRYIIIGVSCLILMNSHRNIKICVYVVIEARASKRTAWEFSIHAKISILELDEYYVQSLR